MKKEKERERRGSKKEEGEVGRGGRGGGEGREGRWGGEGREGRWGDREDKPFSSRIVACTGLYITERQGHIQF